MALFLQTILSGIVLGASYALIAVGLTIAYGIGKVVNFAHGEFVMIAAYVAVVMVTAGVSYPLAVCGAVAAAAVLGIVIEKVIIAPRLYSSQEHASIIVTFALALALTNGIQMWAGTDPRQLRTSLTRYRVVLGDISIDGQRALTAVISVVVMVLLGLWLTRSRSGMQLVALSQNPRGALYTGINVSRVRTIAFGLGTALAGLGGALLAPTLSVYPSMGNPLVVTAFTVVVLGGLGSIGGATLAAFVVGLCYSFVSTYMAVEWTAAFGWLLVIIMLLARPQGLMGAKPTRA
jgi:branched-chain amino acid transport system permease protein